MGFSLQQFSLCAEILRVSGMLSNQGFGDFDRLRHRSPSPMASSNLMSSVTGTGLGGWNSLQQEVTATSKLCIINLCLSSSVHGDVNFVFATLKDCYIFSHMLV